MQSSSLTQQMQRDAARLLYDNALSGILITLVASSFLVYAFDSPLWLYRFVWWAVMCVLLMHRLRGWKRWQGLAESDQYDGADQIRRFARGARLTALLWAVYAVMIILTGSLLEIITTLITVSAMAGGSATVLAGDKKTALFYAFVLLIPASVCLLLVGNYERQVLGVLGICFGLVMMLVSRKAADFTQNAILLKNENAVLVNEMERKVEDRTRRIYELSNLDPLTGLYNRSAFVKKVAAQLDDSNKERIHGALLFIDLDGFKQINDRFGHETGDFILQASATRLQNMVHDGDVVCRWGGDEFLLWLQAIDNDRDAELSAEKVIASLSEPHISPAGQWRVGATIGIALWPVHSDDIDVLIRYADTAMYIQKKRRPSHAIVFEHRMAAAHKQQLMLRDALACAIERQEFRLVYQPIVESTAEAPCALEVLLRWRHDGEDIPPAEFIPIAEKYGLILPIGEWVLRQACTEMAASDIDADLRVCVNVSVLQLEDEGFIDMVKAIIRETGVRASRLQLEITESVFAADQQLISSRIRALRAMQLGVSIDDFGTGYSSLSVLQNLAVDTVKIDRSFIQHLDSTGYAIVTAVIHAARHLNFDVVAEGVETAEQHKTLAEIGVSKLQGFYFSRPVELQDLRKYFDSVKADSQESKRASQ